MPELPEVETIRRQLGKKIIGKTFQGQKIINVRRRAKILIIDFEAGHSLIFHFKMTGQLIFNGKPWRYTRKVFIFDDGSKMIFNDTRKFGWWKKVKTSRKIEDQFGPEALEISLPEFKTRLISHRRAKIKNLLLNQKIIAGLGNIYTDEALFAAKIHPLRTTPSLSQKEWRCLYNKIRLILRSAIKHHGSSVSNYSDALGQKGHYAKKHKVYRKEGEDCYRCRTVIEKIKIAGRTARFCPVCQKIT